MAGAFSEPCFAPHGHGKIATTPRPQTRPPDMSTFRDWLTQVLTDGQSVQDEPPALDAKERAAVCATLRRAYVQRALDIAGTPLQFDEAVAVWAVQVLAASCWELASGSDDVTGPAIAREPDRLAAHLSADVSLRFLPAVLARARARGGMDCLVERVTAILRRWPLSGVLAGLAEAPLGSLEFDGHVGLQMLYAERQVDTGQVAWLPDDGNTLQWIEKVYHERGKLLPTRAIGPEEAHVE